MKAILTGQIKIIEIASYILVADEYEIITDRQKNPFVANNRNGSSKATATRICLQKYMVLTMASPLGQRVPKAHANFQASLADYVLISISFTVLYVCQNLDPI